MPGRHVLLYYAWSRPGETSAPLADIDDRFPALFELRRLFYPRYEGLADPASVDQGIAGFLDHIQKPNFAAFAAQAAAQTGHPVLQVERVADDGTARALDDHLVAGVDTIVIISFDSLRTGQAASGPEIEAVRRFLSDPDHLIFVCPHHDIGEAMDVPADRRIERQTAEYLHHGDCAGPPRQGFGGFAKTLLAGLGAPVDNRYGLRPATAPDGSPAPIEIDRPLDILGLLDQVDSLNLHPHLPQLERMGEAAGLLGVLARQQIDPAAPPHPAWPSDRTSFDAVLQSLPDVFAGTLLVCDTTLFSSTAGGADRLRRLWSNVLLRPERG